MAFERLAPISDKTLYARLPFARSSDIYLPIETGTYHYYEHASHPKIPDYLYSFAIKFELYDYPDWDRCISSFIIGDTYPVNFNAHSGKLLQDIAWAEMLVGFDHFWFQGRNQKILTPSKDTEVSDIVDFVIKVAASRDTKGNPTRDMHFNISGPSMGRMFPSGLAIRSFTGSDTLANFLCFTRNCLETESLDTVLDLVAGENHLTKAVSDLQRCGRFLNEFVLGSLCILKESITKLVKDHMLLALAHPFMTDDYTQNYWMMEYLHKHIQRLQNGCIPDNSDSPAESTSPALPFKKALVSNVKKSLSIKYQGPNRHLIYLFTPLRLNKSTTQNFGTGLEEYGRFVLFETTVISNKK